MASRKSPVKKILIKKLPKFELDVYANLSLSDLVVFALSYLEEKEIDASTEEIVSICFRLFPQKFAMKNYPRWPDSALVIRRLNDDREKKNIKGNPADGFALTFKGKQVAKRVAKLLGIKKKGASKKKKQKPAPLVLTKKTLRRRFRKPIQTKPVKKKKKKIIKSSNDFSRSVKKTTKVVTTKVNKKKATKVATPKVKINKAKSGGLQTRPTKVKQKTKPLTTPAPVKKKVSVNKKQVQVKKEAAKPVKMEVVVSVSKEEKIKAGKVMHLVEKSDAYKLYKKNGKQAKISEFDFRNMLFTTMESSSETLTRNVLLFKKYANIHSRNDLIKFFDFCEEFFAKLLKKR